MEIKTKVNKWDLTKFKSFCTAKEIISKVKRKPSEWEKNNSKWNNWQRIYFQNIQAAHTIQCQKNNPIKKWGKNLNRHFTKEDMKMANKHMKICSTLLITRETQIKATVRYHLTQVRMSLFETLTSNNAGEGVEKRQSLQ